MIGEPTRESFILNLTHTKKLQRNIHNTWTFW